MTPPAQFIRSCNVLPLPPPSNFLIRNLTVNTVEISKLQLNCPVLTWREDVGDMYLHIKVIGTLLLFFPSFFVCFFLLLLLKGGWLRVSVGEPRPWRTPNTTKTHYLALANPHYVVLFQPTPGLNVFQSIIYIKKKGDDVMDYGKSLWLSSSSYGHRWKK